MKQSITDAHIWEVFQSNTSECPLCTLIHKYEARMFETLYTDMVMDVDFNVEYADKLRFCREHYRKLYEYQDKLGLAIVAEKLLAREINLVESSTFTPKSDGIARRIIDSMREGVFDKKKSPGENNRDCFICARLDNYISGDINTIIKLWNEYNEFKELYSKSSGFCVGHYESIVTHPKCNTAFVDVSRKIQYENLKRIKDELNWFINKYDYRFKDAPWGNSRDALIRAILKLTGDIQ